MRFLGYELRKIPRNRRIWLDVGSHQGQRTFGAATADPSILVYAFEPDWRLARQTMGKLSNFVTFPMAVSDIDGIACFHLNSADGTSSLLPFNKQAQKTGPWQGIDGLTQKSTIEVPAIRLDTFLNRMQIARVEFLKIDTQGFDFRVVQSAGTRLRDIDSITLEVDLAPVRLYEGSAAKHEVMEYMLNHGLELTKTETQNEGREENLTFSRSRANP